MNFETIYATILAAAPAISSIIGCIIAVVKMKNNQAAKLEEVMGAFETLRLEVKDSKEYQELKGQLIIAHQENRELRRKLNEFLMKIDHIRRNDDEE